MSMINASVFASRRRDDAPKGMLPNNREEAIAKLFKVPEQKKDRNGDVIMEWREVFDKRTHRKERKLAPVRAEFNGIRDEVPSVILYLNYAINNLWSLAGMPAKDTENVDQLMKKLNADETAFERIADFLWTFKFDEPQRDFSTSVDDRGTLKDWKTCAEKIIRKIFDLRQFFIHSSETGIGPVELNENLYRFLEGVLGNEARTAAGTNPAFQTDKVNKLKIANKFGRDNPKFQLTRKGIIFLVCLALYKDEAEQFCSLMHDLKLPNDNRLTPGEMKDLTDEEFNRIRPSGKKKALRAFFTHFSYRRGRKSLDAENQDHILFADLVTHLNKVPEPAYEYLKLDAERERLAALASASTEDEKNKREKYALRKRDRAKFSQYVAAYLEDVKGLPSVHFKRLDISPSTGRRKYLFGAENDNAVIDGEHCRTDRHFAVYDGGVRFEWRATEHYTEGGIRIKSLRSSLAESDLPKIVLACNCAAGRMDAHLNAYFSAYHRILERMVNTEDFSSFSIGDETYLKDFSVVSGRTADEIKADFKGCLKPFFPMQLLRYFTKESGSLSESEKVAACKAELERTRAKADEFIRRLKARDEIKALSMDKRPSAKVKLRELSLKYPPNTLRFSPGDFVHQVFILFNLFLTPENRFRQLSLGEQHHKGIKDFEYQMLHASIGKFALDQKGFKQAIEKDSRRSKTLLPITNAIIDRARELGACGRRPLNGRKPGPRLQDLAVAACEQIVGICEEYLSDDEIGQTVDCYYGPVLGVGMGADRSVDNLRRVILGIDYDKWSHAYDYEHHAPFAGRRLDAEDHVVSQVPLPCGVVSRFFTDGPNAPRFRKYVVDGRFNAGAAIRERLKVSVGLRHYYDISPLVTALKTLKANPSADLASVDGLKTMYEVNMAEFGEEQHKVEVKSDLSRPALKAAAAKIKRFELQDRVLLFVAGQYRRRSGMGADAGDRRTDATIYDYFTEMVPVKGILVRRNDLLRPVFATIAAKKKEIAQLAGVGPDEKGNYSFYDLQKAYQETRSRDFGVRRSLMPRLARFEGLVRIYPVEYERTIAAAKAAGRPVSIDIREMEYKHYRRVFPKMTFEEYDTIVEARNLVCHQDNFNIVGKETIVKAEQLLKKYLR